MLAASRSSNRVAADCFSFLTANLLERVNMSDVRAATRRRTAGLHKHGASRRLGVCERG